MNQKFRILIGSLALVFLVFAVGVFLGSNSIRKELNNQDLGALDAFMINIIEAPAAIKAVLTNNSLALQQGELPNAPKGNYDYFESVKIDAPYMLLYSYFDFNKDVSNIFLVDIATKDTIRKWELPFQKMKEIHEKWHAQVGFKYHKALRNLVSFTAMNKLPFHSVTLFSKDKVIFQLDSPGPIICLNSKNQIEWVSDKVSHHSVELDGNGDIWTCSYNYEKKAAFLDDEIVKINRMGKVVYKKRIRDIALEHPELNMISVANQKFDGSSDPYHLNDVQPVMIDSKQGYWKKGDVFVSVRHQNIVFLYRPSTDSVLWHRDYPWLQQHDVAIVNDSVISIFDNRHPKLTESFEEGYNQAVFYDFSTDSHSLMFENVYHDLNVFTPTQGRLQFFEPDSVLFIEAADQGFMVLKSLKTNQQHKFVFKAHQKNKVMYLRWNRLVSKKYFNSL